jgi:UDP-N-acetylglucosamine 1-carboxyvinyltransferase
MNIKVQGGQTLSGEVYPSGSKNSAVALIPASILIAGEVVLENIPEITDVKRLVEIMEKLGSKVTWNKEDRKLHLDNTNLSLQRLNRDDLGNMKGTSLLWGPLLARFKKVIFDDLPGGCTLGARPLDPQYDAFAGLRVAITETKSGVNMDSYKAKAGEVWLTEMSPTVTENMVMLALYAAHPDFVVPETRYNEMKRLVEQGLEDMSISRSKERLSWGIPVPGDDPYLRK